MIFFFLSLYIPTFRKDVLDRCVKEVLDPIEKEKCKDAIQELLKQEHRVYRLDQPSVNNPYLFRPQIQLVPAFFFE